MIRYVTKRLFQAAITLWAIVTLVFLFMRLLPVEGYFPEYDRMDETQIQAALTSMGLNLSLIHIFTAVETVGIDPQVEVGRLSIRYATQENETGEAIPWLRNQGHIARLDLSCVAVTGDGLLKDEGGIDCLQADDEVKAQL